MNTTDRAALIARLREYGGASLALALMWQAAAMLEADGKVVLQEPVAYLAWRDGKPCWEGDDCVCADAVYPVDHDDDRTSMPVYLAPQPQPAVPQEPVAWKTDTSSGELRFTIGVQTFTIDYDEGYTEEELKWMEKQLIIALSRLTAPQPQRPRLTDEEIKAIEHETDMKSSLGDWGNYFARAIEKKVRGEA